MTLYTVSQIARRTGLTVRALHHYEAEGLLSPRSRSAAGYRRYGDDELRRLQHIVSLKALGFSLAEIRACLDADAPSLAEALARQVARLRTRVARQQDLLARLEGVAARISNGAAIDADTLLSSIEATTIMDKYFTAEQQQQLRRQGEAIGPARIRAVENEWPAVIAGMQAALRLDKDPACEEVQALAGRWRALLREFTGGDAGIRKAANTMFREEPERMREQTGIDPALMAYACKAIALLPEE